MRDFVCVAVFTAQSTQWDHVERGQFTKSPVHRDRFTHVSIYLRIRKFAYVCKLAHVYAFTHVSKLYTIRNFFLLHLVETKCKSLFAYMINLHMSILGHVYAQQNLLTGVLQSQRRDGERSSALKTSDLHLSAMGTTLRSCNDLAGA